MSIYSEATLGAPDNYITFNDYSADPVFRALARSASKFQIRQQDLPVPFESGSSDFLTLLGDTSYIIEGKMYPASEASYDAGLNTLRTVCSLDLNQADILSNEGYVPYLWQDYNYSQQIFMKPLYVEISETTQQGFVQPFTILAKIKDPTIYSGTLSVASTGQASPSTSTGAAVYPFNYPIVYGSTLFTVSATCNNVGTIPVYPVTITVTGPVTNPRITNSATGEYIEVDVTLSGTDQLNIIYDKDTLNINKNGTSVINFLSSSSTLFKIHPGSTTIILSGQSVGTGAVAQVEFYSGWPLG
jgi:hypothetical protein